MTTGLLIALLVLVAAHFWWSVTRKVTVDVSGEMERVERSVAAFGSLLERNEKLIRDEFQRNRSEAAQQAKDGREELARALAVFGDQFDRNVQGMNALLRERMDLLDKRQQQLAGQVAEHNKLSREELTHSLKSFEDKFAEQIERMSELLRRTGGEQNTALENFRKQFSASIKELIEAQQVFAERAQLAAKADREELGKSLKSFEERFTENTKTLNASIQERFADFAKWQQDAQKLSLESIKEVRTTVEKQLTDIRNDNNNQLGEMRKTVDEKLQSTLEKRLGESFKQVSERLEQVHKGLGEMQQIASGVGDLKKVLTNVKTRGVMGEYQLENILEQLLTPDQFAKNVATKKGSQANVEFAVKLPGKDSEEEVWMPIDSKFPIENYQILLEAYENADRSGIENAQKALLRSVEIFAKDIHQKYIDPPHTTNFAIMFLPVEGLYAEVLRHPGLFEKLQRTYQITVTGPTTLSALLNSLQMGFRTLAVQKRSSEVWKILEAVKTEFNKFADHLEKVDKQLNTATATLQDLRFRRTNAMNRKLRDVALLDGTESQQILALENELDDGED